MPKFPKQKYQNNDETGNYTCDFANCNREFNSKRNLVDHCRGHHEGKKPHICSHPGCGKSFLRPAHLLIHNRIHTGEKPFVCEYEGCGKRWNQKSALKQHLRSHTGEKPFKCPFADCNKKFSTSSSCKRHVSTHFVTDDQHSNGGHLSKEEEKQMDHSIGNNGDASNVSSPTLSSPSSFVQFWSPNSFSYDSPSHSSSSSDEEIDTALLSNFKRSIDRFNPNKDNSAFTFTITTPKMNLDFLLN